MASAEYMRWKRATDPAYVAREKRLDRERYRRKLTEGAQERREAREALDDRIRGPEARAREAREREEREARNREAVRAFNLKVHGDPDWQPPSPTW
jgi:hypothetical protein